MTMNQKKTGFLLCVALAALAAVPTEVDAAAKIVPGTICNHYNGGEAQDMDYLPNAVRNKNTVARNAICAVPREASANGAQVTVVGGLATGNTMPVTVYAYEQNTFTGSGSVTGTTTPFNPFALVVTLNSSQAPAGAELSVLATLPPSYGGTFIEAYADH